MASRCIVRRRSDVARTAGFRLEDALHHLFSEVSGLYEAGMSTTSVQRCFMPPNSSHVAARNYHSLIRARVEPARNDSRREDKMTHFGRCQQKLNREYFALHKQIQMSADDMNIIQVGRPAVSRYHRQKKNLLLEEEGPNHEAHDFPYAGLGVKLGGFMLLDDSESEQVRQRSASF